MTKKEFEMLHPGVKLVMAPITGGADVQLGDYMDGLSSRLFGDGLEDATVFSYEGHIWYYKRNGEEVALKHLFGRGGFFLREMIDKVMDIEDPCEVGDVFEDWTVDGFWISKNGNVFVPDYYESDEHLHNDGYIRCVMVNNEGMLGADLKDIQEDIEEGNDEPFDSNYLLRCTEQIGNDIRFEYWKIDED